MQEVIKIENLYKSFGQVKAVQGLSFKVKEGELFAFLGVNGAGKSTTISIMSGTLDKDSGKVYICGTDIDNDSSVIGRELGIVFQSSVLDKSLTVRDNLVHRASFYGIFGKECDKRIDQLAKLLDFEGFINRSVDKLSGGQKRKIDVARALIHNPKILILDEPTTGLDPQTRSLLWKVINELRKQNGMTVLLTTHYMEEAADADYVVIIDSGKIAAEGTPLQLKNAYASDYVYIYNAIESQVKQLDVPYEKIGSSFVLKLKNTKHATELILKNPSLFTDYEITKGKMDSVFLAVTGKNLGGDDK